ncbi:uncharacterized protein PGTG_06494 [Puccinia graminis f. sp. tritici CRL 75-36-700-3]|uniref:Uncharacterized protein n=1 Tax=Puccinia graminis f. sp. tritici (strain CRL 75-36-700-3 / race SCCL) TaxID=418459 RepID=E3K8S1_PUCGT|nr:uncharacterized protein PGTG_06494 [Puccinia graminis f. sp. tritici CRL 75-36-700-3]EFP80538.2 hypothetical protein PGTG_06494 [Puccinia graminis f. sp. tritici CRL 75-36-700-3]
MCNLAYAVACWKRIEGSPDGVFPVPIAPELHYTPRSTCRMRAGGNGAKRNGQFTHNYHLSRKIDAGSAWHIAYQHSGQIGVLAAEAHSTAGQTGESRWVHRQLGLPNLTPLSTSSTRSEPAGLFPFPSALPPHAPGCHHERQVEKETCSSFETQKKKNARSI